MTDERKDEGLGEDEARAVRALDAAERADAPPGLVGAVMQAVRALGASDRQLPAGWRVFKFKDSGMRSPGLRRHESIPGGSMSSKKVLLGVAAVAVIAIGYVAVKGFPPVGDGAEGTVGAAKKFQSEQISAQDVVLQDADVQQVLQSDALRRVIADKETRAILASQDFQKAMSDANVLALLQQLAADKALNGALALSARDAATQKVWAGIAADRGVQDALGRALDSAQFQRARDEAGASQRAVNEAFTRAVNEAAGRDSAASGLLRDAASSEAFLGLVQNPAFAKALDEASFVKLLGSNAFVGLITNNAFNRAFESRAVRDAAANGVLVQALNAAALDAATNAARDGASSAARAGDQAR